MTKIGKYGMIEKLYTQLIDDSSIQVDVEAINNEFKEL